jgi:outer membrane receptor protein involved in Fe transport
VTPMASVQYRWTPDLMTYGSYSEGFKSGGMNTRIIQPVIGPNAPTGREFLPQFDPEKVKSYELGAKAVLFGNLRVSGAVFRSKYNDIHIVVREGVAPVVRNAGKATIDGVELEWNLASHTGFELTGGVGYTDFQYGPCAHIHRRRRTTEPERRRPPRVICDQACSSRCRPPMAAVTQAMNAPINIERAVKREVDAATLRALSAAWRAFSSAAFS